VSQALANAAATGVSRCFPFWQEYLACHIMNQDNPDPQKKGVCGPVLEDYYECLHHKKEVSLPMDLPSFKVTMAEIHAVRSSTNSPGRISKG
jgi:NADH dehydrogenase (ubiquinone) Fe-S protein 5